MVASEAGLVINSFVGGEAINQINGLVAASAFLGGSCEGHGFQHPPTHPLRNRNISFRNFLFCCFSCFLSPTPSPLLIIISISREMEEREEEIKSRGKVRDVWPAINGD